MHIVGYMFCFPSVLFCIFEMLLNIYRKKREKKLQKAIDRGAQSCYQNKHLLLALSISGGCGRKGSLRTESREHWPGG